jgi:ornithine cyclodeaminase/alanine dehydrogenase-like protein (mu-crystallin family)
LELDLIGGETESGHSCSVLQEKVMALFLTEADVRELLPMERALECVEASLRAQASGRAMNRARERILLPHCSLHYMAAALPEEKWLGMKIYTVTRADSRFLVLLFDAESGSLLALMQADHLGRLRTGAASGIATKYLARREASRVGLIGTGRQARTQLEAVAKVRKLTAAKVFSRDEQRRRDFCREMSAHPALAGLAVEPAESAEEAGRFGEIVITATTSRDPVVLGSWLEPGTHINAVGANMADRRELDEAVLSRAAVIAVDSLEQSRKEAGDLIQGLPRLRDGRGWEGVVELHSIVAGALPGRRSGEEITLFKSVGIALWDVAVAGYLYRQALEKGKGRQLELQQA